MILSAIYIYVYVHFVSGGNDCNPFSLLPFLQVACISNMITWIVVCFIGVGGWVIIQSGNESIRKRTAGESEDQQL